MTTGAALLAILQGLPALMQLAPDLVNLAKELMTWLNHVSGNDPQGYVKRVGQAFAALNAAQTPEDRQAAAKGIADAIAHLP